MEEAQVQQSKRAIADEFRAVRRGLDLKGI
jgi:hypothetical protein